MQDRIKNLENEKDNNKNKLLDLIKLTKKDEQGFDIEAYKNNKGGGEIINDLSNDINANAPVQEIAQVNINAQGMTQNDVVPKTDTGEPLLDLVDDDDDDDKFDGDY